MHTLIIRCININELGKPSKIKNKKVWNFPYFSGVGGFEKVIFHKNKKCLKLPEYSFKSNLFFPVWGWSDT